MCSTSSSECECGCNEQDVYRAQGACGSMRPPYFTTMGRPMIYYAQVQQPPKRQRSRENRKSNQNCFTKAFKWYTEEHVPYRNDTSNKTDMNGFAVWLDSKYDEFLRYSQLDNVQRLKVNQTSITETDRIPNKPCCEPPRSKKFRVKSPWRKRQSSNSKEGGDGVQKPNQSFHVILQPKDLSRATSEYCQKSNVTVTSMEILMKRPIRSRSYTVVPPEHATSEPSTSLPPAPPESAKFSDNRTKTTIPLSNLCQCSEEKSDNRAETTVPRSISCQCSVEQVVKINAQTQSVKAAESVTTSVNQITPRKILCQPCPCKISTTTPKEVETDASYAARCCCAEELCIPTKSPSNIAVRQNSPSTFRTCQCVTDMEEPIKLQNVEDVPQPMTFLDDCIQTSDHSIRFEKDDVHGYSLFMKIVCADKLLSKQ